MNKIFTYLLNALTEYIELISDQKLIEILTQYKNDIERIGYKNLSEQSKEELNEILSKLSNLVVELVQNGRTTQSADIALELTQISNVLGAVDDVTAFLSIEQALSYSWSEYCEKLASLKVERSFDERIKLLSLIKERLKAGGFSSLSKISRYMIGGRQTLENLNALGLRCGLFGSMKGAGFFNNLLKQRPEFLDEFISAIPKEGPVSKEQYMLLVALFRKSLLKADIDREYLRPFTRLLAVIRPDLFFCITSRNEYLLRTVLGVPALRSNDYERYWDNYLSKIYQAPWFNCSEVEGEFEFSANSAKVALIDMLFYQNEVAQKALSTANEQVARTQRMSEIDAIQIMSDYARANKDDFPKNVRGSMFRSYIVALIMKKIEVSEVFNFTFELANFWQKNQERLPASARTEKGKDKILQTFAYVTASQGEQVDFEKIFDMYVSGKTSAEIKSEY